MLSVMKRDWRKALDDGSNPESDACVMAARLGITINMEVEEFFQDWGVTVLQFNVLRILYVRDAERQGISRGNIEARLIHRVPDVTRLLDRLEAAELIERYRPAGNQRTVLARLTDKGIELVEKSHRPLLALNRQQLSHFTRAELDQFITLLKKALERPALRPAAAAK
jgi:DNA-binding MarR family transcriptional regulator